MRVVNTILKQSMEQGISGNLRVGMRDEWFVLRVTRS